MKRTALWTTLTAVMLAGLVPAHAGDVCDPAYYDCSAEQDLRAAEEEQWRAEEELRAAEEEQWRAEEELRALDAAEGDGAGPSQTVIQIPSTQIRP